MRILIVANDASSQFGGEAFLPFNYFRLLRLRKADVRLLVHDRNRQELTAVFPEDLDRLFFVNDTRFHKLIFRLGRCLPRRIASVTTDFLIQLTTQFAQRRVIRGLLQAQGLDVIHVPTPVSPKTPSMFFGFNAAVMMGPLNGGMEYPQAFRKAEGALTRLVVGSGRRLANFLNFIIPGKRRAQLIAVANCRTRKALPSRVQGRVVELVENGVDLAIWKPGLPKRSKEGTLRLVFVGRLVDWKALDIAVEAIHRLAVDTPISFEIIGDGPMRESWEALVNAKGLGSVVRFSGWMSQQQCATRLQQADVFLLPSLFECGGAVVLEAMAMGLPVIATAWGGPLDYLDETCGILVPPSSRNELVAGFSQAIERLAASPALCRQLGQAALERAKGRFDWDHKVDQILGLYKLAAEDRGVARQS
jgi:glycosyltransferase involved in cell wall biosynthesis